MYYSKISYNFIEIITGDSDKEGHYYRFFSKLVTSPIPFPLQISFHLPAQFKLPVPRTFLHPFLHIFAAVLCNNSCNLTKQFRGCTFKHLAYLGSPKESLFAIHCLFCVAVQLVVILLNLAVVSVFDCLIRFCKG